MSESDAGRGSRDPAPLSPGTTVTLILDRGAYRSVLSFRLGPEEHDEYLITTVPEGGDEPGVGYAHGLRLRGSGRVSRVHVTTERRSVDTEPELHALSRGAGPGAPRTPDPAQGTEERDATRRSSRAPSA
jgi:hypothetical protein